MKVSRKIIRIDEEKCNGCGLCVPSCAEGAIRITDGKARLVGEKYCDGLGACLGECPRGALRVVDAEADPFDELISGTVYLIPGIKYTVPEINKYTVPEINPEAAEKSAAGKSLPCGCPSMSIQTFTPQAACDRANVPASQTDSGISALTHWPVQIRLVPPTAPFLRGADLLVAADCTPVAYPRFHDDLLKGKTVLLGCPKFDDAEAYVKKFAAIFETAAIKSVMVAVMEVPCCQGLPVIVQKGMALAGKKIPIEVVVISTRGEKKGAAVH